jgi:hypothetical protein
MTAAKSALKLFATCLAYSSIVILIDSVLVLFFSRESNQIVSSLSFIMLVEGGLGLTIGGAIALYSPIVNKMGEVLFRSKPWSATSQKEAEKQAKTWIATGTILVLLALLISAL